MKLISATLMTAAGAAAAMLWMNKDRYLTRQAQGSGTGGSGVGRTDGTSGSESDFSSQGTAPSVQPAAATH
jgi:hypothetical protein